jgi:hypothetical protein
MSFHFNNTQTLSEFNGAVKRHFLPPTGVSLNGLYYLLFLHNNPSEGFKLTHLGLCSDRCNTLTSLCLLIKLGLINKVGNIYSLTGKGNILVGSFLEFSRIRGVLFN